MLTDEEKAGAIRLFAMAGHHQSLRIWPVTSDDERIFVLDADVIAGLPSGIVADLQAVLHRKVWLVPPRTGDPQSTALS